MAFDFIPRSIGASKQKRRNPFIRQGTATPKAHLAPASPVVIPNATLAVAAKSSPNDEELLVLIGLSLSDYAFWSNPYLHHKLRSAKEGCA